MYGTISVMVMFLFLSVSIFSSMSLISAESLFYLISAGPISVGQLVMSDFYSYFFTLFLLLIYIAIMIFSMSYMGMSRINYFNSILFLFVMSMILLIYMYTPPLIVLGWDGLGVTSFFLVIYYSSAGSLSSGLLTVLTNRLGDGFLILGVTVFLISTPILDPLFILLMMLAAVTKSAQLPYVSWLPAAMAAPTPVSSLVHSSTLVTAGVYLVFRITGVHPGVIELLPTLFLVSVITCLYASMTALYEKDFKKIVAYSTLSQLGFMLLALSSGSSQVCMFHLFTHAGFKSLMFINVGLLIHMNKSQSSLWFQNSFKSAPIVSWLLFMCAITMSGMCFTSGYLSKDLVWDISQHYNLAVPVYFATVMTVLLTILYSVKFMMYVTTCMNPLSRLSSINNTLTHMPSLVYVATMVYVPSYIFYSYFYWYESVSSCYMKVIPIIMLLSIIFMSKGLSWFKSGWSHTMGMDSWSTEIPLKVMKLKSPVYTTSEHGVMMALITTLVSNPTHYMSLHGQTNMFSAWSVVSVTWLLVLLLILIL